MEKGTPRRHRGGKEIYGYPLEHASREVPIDTISISNFLESFIPPRPPFLSGEPLIVSQHGEAEHTETRREYRFSAVSVSSVLNLMEAVASLEAIDGCAAPSSDQSSASTTSLPAHAQKTSAS